MNNEHILSEIVRIMKESIGIIDQKFQIEVDANFFELGGDSIDASSFMIKINEFFELSLSYTEVFDNPTAKGITDLILTKRIDKEQLKERMITHLPEVSYYPISSTQNRFLAISQLDTKTSYNLPFQFILSGEFDVDRFEKAYNYLIETHEILRTTFEWIDNQMVQKIHPFKESKITYLEVSLKESNEIASDFIHSFKLDILPLIRVLLLKIDVNVYKLLLDVHHIIMDGFSIGLFMKELSQIYNGTFLEPPSIQYRDYAAWQNERFKKNERDKDRKYWLENLEGEIPVLNLPTDYPRPILQNFDGDRLFFYINTEISGSLKKVARQGGSTLYMVLLAGYYILLSRYSGQKDIIVGVPSSGRHYKDIEKLLGLFVNTLPVRGFPDSNQSFLSFLNQIKESTIAAYEHQDYPLEKLVEELKISRDLSQNPLFNTLFVLQNIPDWNLDLRGVACEAVDMVSKSSKLDISIEAFEQEGKIKFTVEYATRLFKKETIQRMIKHYINILTEVADNPSLKLEEINMISDEEKEDLFLYNKTERILSNKTIQQVFEERTLNSPNAIAVKFGKEQITYRELNNRANQVAHQLRIFGVKRDEIIAILVERSIEMMVVILGILKSGAAYLPLDPRHPDDRILYMLKDSNSRFLLIQKTLINRTEFLTNTFHGTVLGLDGILTESAQNIDNPEFINEFHDLAYVIYTSGSTGKPKGVMIEHRSLINRIEWMQEQFDFSMSDKFLQKTVYTFDVSVWELFLWFYSGSTLILLEPEAEKDPESILSAIINNGVTVLHFVPSMLSAFVSYLKDIQSSRLNSLKFIFTSGEALSCELLNNCLSYTFLGGAKIINLYGPTETTIDSTFFEFSHDRKYNVVPIGKPIFNTHTYIINRHGQLQPIGIDGELCIGGAGMARGYLNQPELTAEKFVENPYRPGERMYRTGDVARWLPDGNIEFLGRIDHQVKIRGYRIEPGEIENQLLKHPKVREAVVIAQLESDGQSQALCAYVVGDSGLKSSILREYLSQELPEYMIPSYFIALEELPLTPNGKVDRKALPKPEAGMASGRAYEAPSNEIESQMAEIWQGVLGREKVGLNDHFFELGGDSIKGIQVCARLYKHGWKLEMKHLFQYPVLRDACTQVVPLQRKAEQGLIEGEVSLLPIQQWFFEQNLEEAEHWNQAMMLQGKPRFEEKSLEEALRKLVEHHDGLRTVFSGKGQEAKGYNLGVEEGMVNLAVVDLTEEEDPIRAIKEQAEEAQRNFDIEKGPLFRAKVFRTQTEDHLLLVAHHLVIDGVSWRILLEDLAIAYEQVSQGQPVGLQEKTDSVKEWSKGLRNYAISKELLKEVPYWREMEQSTISTLPKDSEPQSEAMKYNGVASIQLSRKDTVLLLEEVNRAYNTEINDLLLTALAQTVQKWTGESAMAVNMEGHGREEIIDSLTVTRTVGWYTSMYPVVLEPTSNADVGMQLKQVKETLRQVPKKGVGYGILRYLTPMEEREGLTFTLKPEISFNYLGQFDADLNTSLFKRSPYETGQTIGEGNQRLYEIDIVGMVDNGRMALNFNYNTDTYRPETMEEIAASYKEQLLILIYHCVNQTVTEVTPSDLAEGDINIKDIEEILNLFS
ncbi:amino acid adenylation domain-containing protein [Paenibacillus sp. FSL R5-0744]|uniref:amino acid adenylation domain-containing protein n=1 Tax=Paenibacillus sp. FSL R5-0744 TaxID=2921656 RepID=UPI0030DC549C